MTKRRNCSARHTDSGDTSKRFSRGQSRDRDNSAPASRCSIIPAELVSPPARSSAGPARFSSGLLARRAALFPVPADAFTAAPMSGMICLPAQGAFDRVWHPVFVGLSARIYLKGGSDAHSGFGDFDDCDGFDGGARTGPDLRSGLPGLSAQVRNGGIPLLRLQLHVAASVQCIGIGSGGTVRHQSLFCWRGLSAASPRLLKRMTI